MRKIVLLSGLCLFIITGALSAVEVEDGFGSAKKIEGRYFTIYYLRQVEVSNLTRQLNITAADKILAGKSISEDIASEPELAKMADILYGLVSDMLDMHIYDFKGDIKICLDQQQLNNIYKRLFGKEPGSYTAAFYVNEISTVYISEENFRREVLGHEIAHAIINRYFVVSPPVTVQEILAKYTEYQLRKSAKQAAQ